jgi:hypothetical protein
MPLRKRQLSRDKSSCKIRILKPEIPTRVLLDLCLPQTALLNGVFAGAFVA